MRTTIFIIIIVALLCSCGGKRNVEVLSASNAKAENIEKSEEGVSSDITSDLADTSFSELSRNLTVIP
jgi:high-affinity Fe2+/Pb2+ permease